MNTKIILAVLVLALTSMACGFTVDLPKVPTAGPLVTDEITVADSGSNETSLSLAFGAGELILSPGAEGLVEGTATYNLKDLKPEVVAKDGTVEIKQGNIENLASLDELENKWDLKLGSTPMDLSISTGAYLGRFDLGGLSLTNLMITDGAADVELFFTTPNIAEMTLFHYETGASHSKLSGLANANFASMTFITGAGEYMLDFSGELKRDATVTITSGLSDITLIIPDGVSAEVTVGGAVKTVNARSGWGQSGGVYTREGEGPMLTIAVTLDAGTLTLTE